VNPTLRQGSRGEDVRSLQRRLGINADGIFGPQTAAAVRDFQTKTGLSADSIVGKNTWSALNAESQVDSSKGTDPIGGGDITVPKYNITQTPLGAAELAAINEQRIATQSAYENALNSAAKNESLLRLGARRKRATEDRLSGRRIDDKMDELAGQGLARAPRFAGRFLRREGEDLQLKYGEVDTEMGIGIASLQDSISKAQTELQIALTELDAREARGSTNIELLFPAARQYG
jgi:hypothetical protein